MNSFSRQEERLSKPRLNLEKFKSVLLYIIECCKDKPHVGKTVISKLLYFSDFNHYELYEEQMTGETYLKYDNGPFPKHLNETIEAFKKSNVISEKKSPVGNDSQTKYIPNVRPDLKKLDRREKEVIDDVVNQLADLSTNRISEYSQGDLPWKITDPSDVINYELVFYREKPYTIRNYDVVNDF